MTDAVAMLIRYLVLTRNRRPVTAEQIAGAVYRLGVRSGAAEQAIQPITRRAEAEGLIRKVQVAEQGAGGVIVVTSGWQASIAGRAWWREGGR